MFGSGMDQYTMESNNAEDEDHRERHDNDGVDLESRRFISVEP